MSQKNVIITSGSTNQIIRLPVVSSTTRSATPIEIVTSASGSLTINRTNGQNVTIRSTPERNSNYFSPQSRQSSGQNSPFNRSGSSNREIFGNNEDNSEVKTLYFNSDGNNSREQLLLPIDTHIKKEIEDDEYEEYESMDEEDIEGIITAKTQYKCSGCGKGFCYKGWLDKHKQSSTACLNAHPIADKSFKEPTNYTPLSGNSRERPSLEGRLSELLCCPNENCQFVTHWVQSLNKHVFTACKFAKDNTEDIPKRNSNRKNTNACHLCNKSFNDTEQHISHMQNIHQIKLLYQCSECKMSFDTKEESEAHIEEHNDSRREKSLSRISPKVDNSLSNGSQQCWTCESCNKSYLSLRSYEIHQISCNPSSPETQRPTNRSTQNRGSHLRSISKNSSIKHFRREQIEAIHIDDFKCRYCRKEFESSNGLCNHLSRRPFCREWYYTNLEGELKNANSLHLMPRLSNRLKMENGFDRSSQSSPAKQSSGSSASLLSRSRKTVNRTVNRTQIIGPNGEKTNSARCDKCRKVFVGKNPCVALTNHLRGSTCMGPSKYPSQRPQVHKSRHKVFGKRQTNRPVGENRFYCKLCPQIELKNRVSLGCHLTIYHGLPQVNVSNEKGDAFRCQTCSQVFESKYFYNVHRQDCDLTSQYVGIISGEHVSQIRPNDDQTGVMCGLCGRTGFLTANQVTIHQKYQCVKTHQNRTNQSNLKRYPTQTARSPKPKAIPMAEMARLNDRAKNEPKLTMCDQCGKGPYNSYSHFMEHKKKYCFAMKGVTPSATNSKQNYDSFKSKNIAKKSFGVPDSSSDGASKENFCLNPTIPRARKTINFANVSSPQVSHDSSAPMDTNENESEEEVPNEPEVTKCSLCPEEFDDILAFIRHRLSHITEELVINETVEAMECELCGARVHHYQRIQQHLILHLQNVQILKKKNLIEVMKRSHINRHLVEESDEDIDGSVLQCPYCKSEYLSRTELAEHIKKTCPFRYQCPNCSNTYSAKESYLEHRECCTKSSTTSKITPKAPTYKCRNCNVEFKIKQQLLWHEHACNKVYAADHSGRVEEVIERTLTCSVCGLVSDVYDRKVKHESQCLKRYLAVIGNSTEEIETNCEELSKPMDFDLTSLSNTSESSEVPEEVITNLKQEFGIEKELKVVLNGFDENIIRKLKAELYGLKDESIQFEALKESFKSLVRRLTKNDETLYEMSQESCADKLLNRMLKYLGENPIQHNGLNELNCFRQNLQTFLRLTIKDETLILAYRDAESVDEAIVNMLNFECEFNS